MTGKNFDKPNQGLDNKTIESALFLGSDKCVQENLKQELKQAREKLAEFASSPREKTVVTDFASLEESIVFSENAHYSLFNRDTGREFFINGKDLERRIGIDEALFDKLKARKIDTFELDNSIISFFRAVV